MSTDAKEQEKLMLAALSVKRGETRLADMPKDQREKVRSVLRATSDNTMRTFAQSQAKPSIRRFGQRAPQPRLRRARTA